jgi:diaphanous 1
VLSIDAGHKAVFAAISDYRITYEESFRFETLIGSLRIPDLGSFDEDDNVFGFGNDEEGVWEARTASMALINALTNCSESLEDRVLLREEFGRRGLNEVIVVRNVCRTLAFKINHLHFIGVAIHQTSRLLVDSTRRLHRREI